MHRNVSSGTFKIMVEGTMSRMLTQGEAPCWKLLATEGRLIAFFAPRGYVLRGPESHRWNCMNDLTIIGELCWSLFGLFIASFERNNCSGPHLHTRSAPVCPQGGAGKVTVMFRRLFQPKKIQHNRYQLHTSCQGLCWVLGTQRWMKVPSGFSQVEQRRQIWI